MRCWRRSPLGKPQRFHQCTVHEIPKRRVQVQNVHFCVLHGWAAVVPLPVQLNVVPLCRRRRCLLEPSLPVVDSPLASSTLHEDASSSLATAQTGWPYLPTPMGGPNGPLSGQWRLPSRRPVGGRGWGSGIAWNIKVGLGAGEAIARANGGTRPRASSTATRAKRVPR
jgi:hypothetical protein